MVIEEFSGKVSPDRPTQQTVQAICTRNMNSAGGRTDFIRVALTKTSSGEYEAHPVLGKSGALSTMVAADGFFRIEASSQGIESGEMVVVSLY